MPQRSRSLKSSHELEKHSEFNKIKIFFNKINLKQSDLDDDETDEETDELSEINRTVQSTTLKVKLERQVLSLDSAIKNKD